MKVFNYCLMQPILHWIQSNNIKAIQLDALLLVNNNCSCQLIWNLFELQTKTYYTVSKKFCNIQFKNLCQTRSGTNWYFIFWLNLSNTCFLKQNPGLKLESMFWLLRMYKVNVVRCHKNGSLAGKCGWFPKFLVDRRSVI